MLIEIPDEVAREAERRASQEGRSLREVVVAYLRDLVGLPSKDENSEDTLVGSLDDTTRRALASLDRSGDPALLGLGEDEVMDLAVREVNATRREKPRGCGAAASSRRWGA